MPIIFEHRLGNSPSDKKLRKIYHLHHTLWTLYFTFFFAVVGFSIAILVGVGGNPLFAVTISAVTVGVLVLFLRFRRRRRE
ncbi:hypothetical protein KSC_031130 [Ktedonobacter sp. SOSP1-52]|uniref:hypothetical protein n=1 Tax=Ktedonobacter sp. SOSP1-52 TaxID=2778366 RepID=UPI0019156BAC|nr:hypothetical protein [Ktedonobacter sp. SOSP1-52]GHO64221.1 hypothetical protein KSC_031130 [Ktedonobacter sp. SOSP1-52]